MVGVVLRAKYMKEVDRKIFLCQVEEESSNYIRDFDDLGPKQRTYASKSSKFNEFHARSAEDGLVPMYNGRASEARPLCC